MPQLPYNDKHLTPSPLPIVHQWQAILTGLQEIGRKVSVGGAAWEIVGATIVEVEDHIVILDTPSRRRSINGSWETLPAERHFLALDAISRISRELMPSP